jgi:2-hydroxychromene-2-carboxylate isomerase
MNSQKPQKITLDFYLDLISPFGYLCHHRLRQLAARYPLTVRYHPVELQRIKLAAGNNGPANRDIPPKIKYLTEDLHRWAVHYGIPMVTKLPGTETASLNKGVYFAADRDNADEYVRVAWDSIWAQGEDPGDAASLEGVARRMGWNAQQFEAFTLGEASASRYEVDNLAAIAAGVFGVPTVMIGDDMWWGNDRLNFVEAHIVDLLKADRRRAPHAG